MRLPDTQRQVLAGVAASVAFLGLYLGAGLAPWLALLLGVAVWGAVLLIVQRQLGLEEIVVGDGGVTASDIRMAANKLTIAASRLRALAMGSAGEDKETFRQMAELLESLRRHHEDDPRDYRYTRSFIRSGLDKVMEAVEGYAGLKRKAGSGQAARLDEVGRSIRAYLPMLERIDAACLENDFRSLEVHVAALDEQFRMRPPGG